MSHDEAIFHGFEVMKYMYMSYVIVQYQAYNELALWIGDYKPDIALVA